MRDPVKGIGCILALITATATFGNGFPPPDAPYTDYYRSAPTTGQWGETTPYAPPSTGYPNPPEEQHQPWGEPSSSPYGYAGPTYYPPNTQGLPAELNRQPGAPEATFRPWGQKGTMTQEYWSGSRTDAAFYRQPFYPPPAGRYDPYGMPYGNAADRWGQQPTNRQPPNWPMPGPAYDMAPWGAQGYDYPEYGNGYDYAPPAPHYQRPSYSAPQPWQPPYDTGPTIPYGQMPGYPTTVPPVTTTPDAPEPGTPSLPTAATANPIQPPHEAQPALMDGEVTAPPPPAQPSSAAQPVEEGPEQAPQAENQTPQAAQPATDQMDEQADTPAAEATPATTLPAEPDGPSVADDDASAETTADAAVPAPVPASNSEMEPITEPAAEKN